MSSFDKDYPNRKDRRKPYYESDSRSVDHHCRGRDKICPWCQGKYKYKRKKEQLKNMDYDYEN